MTEYERQLIEDYQRSDPTRVTQLGVIRGAMDEHQRKQDNTM